MDAEAGDADGDSSIVAACSRRLRLVGPLIIPPQTSSAALRAHQLETPATCQVWIAVRPWAALSVAAGSVTAKQ